MTLIAAALAAFMGAAGPSYEGRPLGDVLRELQARGVPVVFSSELVTPAMRVAARPRATEPRQLLDEILKPHRLRIEPGPGGVLLVVRMSPRIADKPPAPHRARTETTARESAPARIPGERVDVAAAADARFDAASRGASTLAAEDVAALAAGADNDPMHAASMLPWAASADDLRVDLSVRGSAPRQSAIVVDGVPAKWLQHTAYGVGDTGSLGMVNVLAVDRLSLLSGVYARPAGDWLGPQLDLTLREGSRTAHHLQTVFSTTSATLLGEGPVGRSARGSWIAAVRQSFREWPMSLGGDGGGKAFGFSDTQLRLVYDVAASQQATVTLLAGRSLIDERGGGEAGELALASNHAEVLSLAWRSTITSSLVARQRLSLVTHRFANVTQAGDDAGEGRDRVLRYDASLVTRVIGGVAEAGIETDTAVSDRATASALVQARGVTRAAFVQAKWMGGGVSIAPGARLTTTTLSAAPALSRWVTAAWSPSARWTLHGSAGVFEAGARADDVSDGLASATLRPEHERLLDASIERLLPGALRWEAGFFLRAEDDLYREGAHATVPDELERGVRGTSRGVEMLLGSRQGRAVSGWIAYAYGRTRHVDVPSGEAYWAPFDQRHGISAAAFYRPSPRASLTAAFKAGSNFPAPGVNPASASRLAPYARLDLRATRSFESRGHHVTLFAEVLNALDRRNVGIGISGPVVLLPRMPSIGVRVEF